MDTDDDYLALSDAALLAQCDIDIYKSSGPGGQHRNKVSSAVRLRHRPSGVSAHGDETRSQHQNKRQALKRLRMNLACTLRRELDVSDGEVKVPGVVASCLFKPRGPAASNKSKLQVGRRDERYWPVASFLLDLLTACEGRLSDAAGHLNIPVSNYTSVLKSNRHLLAAAQKIRRDNGLSGIH